MEQPLGTVQYLSVGEGGEDLTFSAARIIITPLKFFAQNDNPSPLEKCKFMITPPFHENLRTFGHFLKWLYLPFYGK